MWKRLGYVLTVIVFIVYGIGFGIFLLLLGVLWAIASCIEVLLFIPFCFIWILTGKFYSGKINGPIGKLWDKNLPL